jgi:S-adenosylmethionine/arginine decarboxylase-like enzyme
MRPLGEPHIVSIEETGIAGLSGFTFIFESHISIHTYSERGFVTADIYSCKDFDIEAAKEYLLSAFKITASEIHVYARGLRFNDPEFQVQLRPPKRV